MAEIRMPQEMIDWMQSVLWGAHHDRWHFERRWDYWHFRAGQGEQEVQDMVTYAEQQGWSRAATQEGETGNGLDFLMMHRAMIIILSQRFPQHTHFLHGWFTPPQDPADAEDPVASGKPFDANGAAGALRIEGSPASFSGDDDFGLFIETSMRPVPGNPMLRSPDPQTGIHNYLHNRWTDVTSDINIGNPKVNLFNHRFWKLHGWIDYQWWRFRRAKGYSDADAEYQSRLQANIDMMSGHGPHHTMLAVRESRLPAIVRPQGFERSFRE
jgi:hypothetical protein